jgi:hypothetical protein
MNRTQRILVVVLSGALLLSGFALGRITDTQRTSAEENKAALVQPSPAALATAPEERAFYLQDFKTGYDAGYNAALTGQMPSMANTDRTGYTEGFKQGYSSAYQARPIAPVATSAFRTPARTVYYRPATVKRRSSKLKTALTIAAPAAIGAGVGALAGGKKGAGVGALIGGGGGALYHLFKNRD